MPFTNSHNQLRTAEEREKVHERIITEGHEWAQGMPDYLARDRSVSLGKLDIVYKAVDAETDANKGELEAAYEESRAFVHTAFDFYEKRRSLEHKIGRAFVVPMRSNRRDEEYASESIPFVPLLDPERFAVDSDIRMRAMYGYPELILDKTKRDKPNESGALVLAPVFDEMKTDFFSGDTHPKKNEAEALQAMNALHHIMGETAMFAHHYLGAKVIGLGATLPGLTNFGELLRNQPGMDKLVTTTGHGGTVYTIVETARKIMQETQTDSEGKIGVIGGVGSIGWSSAIASLEMIDDHVIIASEKDKGRTDVLRARVTHPDNAKYSDRIKVANSNREVLDATNIIITATTTPIDLDDAAYDGVDLRGKVIIDDSQPGCFNKEQVEKRGGKLVWVVAQDDSESRFVTKDGYHTKGIPYNYGNSSGLYGERSEFACGAEAAVIAAYSDYDTAIKSQVKPNDVRAVGRLFRRANIQVAPLQSFGQPVTIE